MDVTLLNDRLVSVLTNNSVRWPTAIINEYKAKYGLPEPIAQEKVLLDLIVKRAKAVDSLIFYPFFILFLLILSRTYYFDNWQISISLICIIGLSAIIALGSAIRLRRTARKARENTLKKLKEYLFKEIANEANKKPIGKEKDKQNGNGLPDRIKMLIEDVENIDVGPFAPLSRHPIVRAIAMPFGGVGGLYLIDYLAVLS